MSAVYGGYSVATSEVSATIDDRAALDHLEEQWLTSTFTECLARTRRAGPVFLAGSLLPWGSSSGWWRCRSFMAGCRGALVAHDPSRLGGRAPGAREPARADPGRGATTVLVWDLAAA